MYKNYIFASLSHIINFTDGHKNAADYQLHFLISYHVICFISVLQQLQSQPLRLLEVLLLQKLPTSSWSLTSLFCHVLYSPLF